MRPNNPDKLIEKWLFEIENKYTNAKIDKYIIMPDHIHFILFNPDMYDEITHAHIFNNHTGAHIGAPLPEIIKWFKTQTTNEYIKGVKNGLFPAFDKHIWQRNYYEHIIRDETNYYEICQYIDQNPIKWKTNAYIT